MYARSFIFIKSILFITKIIKNVSISVHEKVLPDLPLIHVLIINSCSYKKERRTNLENSFTFNSQGADVKKKLGECGQSTTS